MTKKNITIAIDVNPWMICKTRGENISELCNRMLHTVADTENVHKPTKVELLAQLQIQEAKKAEVQRQILAIESEETIDELKKKEEKHELQRAMVRTMRAAGWLENRQ